MATINSDNSNPPNILFIQCDQLSARATSLYNSDFASTPNLDKLFDKSLKFTKAYTVCPLCMPARAALWSGTYPHDTRVVSNVDAERNDSLPTMGELFSAAGYKTAHFGKTHDANTLRGFEICPSSDMKNIDYHLPVNYDSCQDVDTTQRIVEYLNGIGNETEPFLAVADLNNPHNICQFIGENLNLNLKSPPKDLLPELPPNFSATDWENRPLPIQFIYRTHARQRQTMEWTPDNYRFYLYAYTQYINMVDSQIGEILQALENSGKANNTIVVLAADHGEGMASFGLVTKHQSFYENIVNIPLTIYDPRNPCNRVISDKVVSNLDIFPTFCDYASIPKPSTLRGCSLLSNNRPEYVVSEWVTEYFNTISPARMVVDTEFKYVHFREDNGEELYNLKDDPYEMNNLAKKEQYRDKLLHYRTILANHIEKTDDNYYSIPIVVDEQYRKHTPNSTILDAVTEGRTDYPERGMTNFKLHANSY